MYETKISINLRPVGDRVSIIDIEGGVTAAAESTLIDAFRQASDNGAQAILLGFDRMTYMNSAGIGLLVRLVIRAQRQGQQVMAFGLQEHYRHIFELTRLQEVIHLYATETEAVAAVLNASSEQ